MKNKRGQFGFTHLIIGLLVLFVIIIGIVAAISYNTMGSGALQYSFETVSNGFMTVLGPAFTFLLNLGEDTNTNFLMVLSFILISIIVIGTLDSVNIFGEEKSGNLINFAIGIIISIIGVRFMPSDLWVSLTAPSSAFVATILVGAPFAALVFVTMKIKFRLAGKLLWLFYLIFMSYLIFFPEGGRNNFVWIYSVFLGLAAIMMFFDSTVRRYFYMEKHKKDIEDTIGHLNAQQRYNLRRQIEKWEEIIGDTTAPARDRGVAKTQLANARKRYGDVSAI